MHDVVIIGGGLSGLSAAVELSKNKKKVLLLERRKFCGGRAYSFIDKNTSDYIDNGQHLMMGCYNATRGLLKIIGTEHLAYLQPSLNINFIDEDKKIFNLNCSHLILPFHLVSGLMNFSLIPFNQRLKMLRVALDILLTSEGKENELDRLTVEEWLNKLNQSNLTKKLFWNVIVLGALNNQPNNVSALMLFRVLREIFLGKTENASLLLPKTDLSNLFVNSALDFIIQHGGSVRTEAGVVELICESNQVIKVKITTAEEFRAKTFISAVPWYEAEKILPLHFNNLDKFKPSPIISVYLWFDKSITNLEFAALPMCNFHWFFNKTKLCAGTKKNNNQQNYQCISLIMSGAQTYIDCSEDELVKIAIEDLKKALPNLADGQVINSLVIKERRATFLPSPGLEPYRPAVTTDIKNLFLAGDWTATGYPATIEGAILSGKKAAEKVKEFLQSS